MPSLPPRTAGVLALALALCGRLDAASPECTLAIAPASQHSLAVRGDGTLWAWGLNLEQQTGLPPAGCCILRPAPVPGLPPVVAASSGGYAHSLAVDESGAVWAWGRNDHGQAGDGTRTQVNTPQPVSGLPTAAVAVAGGEYHSLALLADGRVWAWGSNLEGQLGDPAVTGDALSPVVVPGIDAVQAIAAGVAFSLALRRDGSLWVWGRNFEGVAGNGSNSDAPVPVAAATPGDIVAIAAGGYHVLALRADGTLLAWGNNASAQLGLGSILGPVNSGYNTPQGVPGLAGIVALAAGDSHSLALDGSGEVRSWGWNTLGQLGDGSSVSYRASPVRVLELPPAAAIAGGSSHSLAVSTDGELWAWGNNWQGELGDGGAANQSSLPVRSHRPWDPAPPADQGNVLRARRAGPDVELCWPLAPAARFRITGDDAATRLGRTARFTGLGTRSVVDAAAVARPPVLEFYRVQALTCGGEPGP